MQARLERIRCSSWPQFILYRNLSFEAGDGFHDGGAELPEPDSAQALGSRKLPIQAFFTLVGILIRAQLFEDHAGKRQGVICLDLCCKREEVHAAMLFIDILAKKSTSKLPQKNKLRNRQ